MVDINIVSKPDALDMTLLTWPLRCEWKLKEFGKYSSEDHDQSWKTILMLQNLSFECWNLSITFLFTFSPVINSNIPVVYMGTLGGLTEGNELRKARKRNWIYKFHTVTPVTIICNRRKMKKYPSFPKVNADFCCEILLLEWRANIIFFLNSPKLHLLVFLSLCK